MESMMKIASQEEKKVEINIESKQHKINLAPKLINQLELAENFDLSILFQSSLFQEKK